MKYTVEMDIDLPRDEVIRLFDNPENLHKWQPELVQFSSVSGVPGEVGAKSKLRYRMGRSECELLETITKRNLPNEFSGTYETKGVWNLVQNYFTEVGPSRTNWRMVAEFRGTTLFMKLMCLLAPWMFKTQSMRMLKQFKNFAESEKKK
jgi:Polyketide cyclase / dehydrase and lipid transport